MKMMRLQSRKENPGTVIYLDFSNDWVSVYFPLSVSHYGASQAQMALNPLNRSVLSQGHQHLVIWLHHTVFALISTCLWIGGILVFFESRPKISILFSNQSAMLGRMPTLLLTLRTQSFRWNMVVVASWCLIEPVVVCFNVLFYNMMAVI